MNFDTKIIKIGLVEPCFGCLKERVMKHIDTIITQLMHDLNGA
jgi:hypothetical protein